MLILCWPFSARAQNLEGGFHVGVGWVGETDLTPSEGSFEYGVIALLWPTDTLAISGYWSFLPLNDVLGSRDSVPLGEIDRNRQYVDITLQYHFFRRARYSIFAEGGGGSFWNNRWVVNPGGFSDFVPQGKESTHHAMWTVGGGFRYRLRPHVNWINQLKMHNLGSTSKDGLEVFTGVTVSWK